MTRGRDFITKTSTLFLDRVSAGVANVTPETDREHNLTLLNSRAPVSIQQNKTTTFEVINSKSFKRAGSLFPESGATFVFLKACKRCLLALCVAKVPQIPC